MQMTGVIVSGGGIILEPPPYTPPTPPPATTVTASFIASGWNQEVTNSGTLTGPAPLSVFFDATGTTDTDVSIVDTYRQLGYHFDFGYATPTTPGTWTYNGEPKGNQIGGPMATHIYETPGTYTASVRAEDEYGNYSDRFITIVVQDPDVVYANTATVCISLIGNFTGAPVGATTQTTVPTTLSSNTRYLFRCGEDYSATNVTITQSRENIQIGSYGSGARPILQLTLRQTPCTTGNFRQRCITVSNIESTKNLSPQFADYVTYLNCYLFENGFYAGTLVVYYYTYPISNQDMALCTWPKNIFLQECEIDGNFINGSYCGYYLATRYGIQGNYLHNSDTHCLRSPLTYKGFIAHNYLGAIVDNVRAQLKIHSRGADPFTYDTSVTITPMTQYALVADNYIAPDTDNWQLNFQPQNAGAYEVCQDGIYERNVFGSDPSAAGSQKAETAGANRVCYRSITVAPRPATDPYGFNNHSDPGGLQGGIPPELMGPYFVPAGDPNIDNVQIFANSPTVTPNKAGTSVTQYLSGPALLTISADERTNGTVYFGSRSNRMTYDNTRSYDGYQSIKLQLSQGQPPVTCGGSHFFGGRFNLPTLIPEGYNIWYRARFYFPSTLPLGYNFGTGDSAEATTCGKSADGPGFFKFLVFAPDTGTARLYVMPPMQRRGFGLTAGSLHVNTEAENTGDSTYSWTVPRDQWFSLQVHVNVASAATGGGFMRVWIDDQFILQHSKATLANSTYKIQEWGVGDYWNGVPWTDGQLTTTDSFWMDDVIIATDYPGYGAPTTTDSGGRLYIPNAATVNDISYAWVFEGLSTGLTGLTTDESHGTITWDPAGFARINWTSAGVCSINYAVVGDHDQICVQYDVRRNSTHRSKQLKLPATNGAQTSNFTFGPTVGGYSGGDAGYMGLSYSDSITGGDNSTSINLLANLAGGGSRTRAAPTVFAAQAANVYQDITGTVWETWKFWVKCNSVGAQDGEVAVWKNGILLMHLRDMYNCGEPEDAYRMRTAVWLGNYMQDSGYPAYEDYRNLKVGYDRPSDLPS